MGVVLLPLNTQPTPKLQQPAATTGYILAKTTLLTVLGWNQKQMVALTFILLNADAGKLKNCLVVPLNDAHVFAPTPSMPTAPSVTELLLVPLNPEMESTTVVEPAKSLKVKYDCTYVYLVGTD